LYFQAFLLKINLLEAFGVAAFSDACHNNINFSDAAFKKQITCDPKDNLYVGLVGNPWRRTMFLYIIFLYNVLKIF
jgi:hypothetical protein